VLVIQWRYKPALPAGKFQAPFLGSRTNSSLGFPSGPSKSYSTTPVATQSMQYMAVQDKLQNKVQKGTRLGECSCHVEYNRGCHQQTAKEQTERRHDMCLTVLSHLQLTVINY
jgi:hypothetical protein